MGSVLSDDDKGQTGGEGDFVTRLYWGDRNGKRAPMRHITRGGIFMTNLSNLDDQEKLRRRRRRSHKEGKI